MNKFYNFLHRHRYDIFCSIVIAIMLLLIFVVFPNNESKNIVNIIENKTFDIRQNIISKHKHVNKDIIIVTVDDPSYEYLIDKYGDWPIPRHIYAKILDYIQSGQPKYVAFDLLFIKSLNRIPQSDNQLVQAFAKYQNTYTALNFDDYSFDLRLPPVIDDKLSSNVIFNTNKMSILKYTNCRLIMQEIIDATEHVGHINTPKSDDGFIRSIPAIISYPEYDENTYDVIKNKYYLYMTLKIAIDYLNKYENANITDIVIDKNNNLILGKRKIPLTKRGEFILNWYGESGLENPNTFKYVSFWQILKSMEASENGEKVLIPSDFFKDKIVYIGTNVFSLSDIKTVPTGKYFPGVEMHATLLNNIIDNKDTDIIIDFSPNYKDIQLTFDSLTEIATIKENIVTGIQKYRISANNKEIYLKINKPEKILNGNYLIKYYFNNNNKFEYKFDKLYSIKKIKTQADKADICLEFNNFEILNEKLLSLNKINIKENFTNSQNNIIRLKIYGLLYKKANTNFEYNELLDTLAFISYKYSYQNYTEIIYTNNNKFEICFSNMTKTDFIFDMQIKINIIFNEYFFKEDSLIFTLPIDFTNVLKENDDVDSKSNDSTFLKFLIIVIIIILLVFIVLYFKLRKKTKNLEELVFPTSLSLSSINSDEILEENSKEKKSGTDNAFI
mgnify:CR=1 FL=1